MKCIAFSTLTTFVDIQCIQCKMYLNALRQLAELAVGAQYQQLLYLDRVYKRVTHIINTKYMKYQKCLLFH